MRIEIDDYILRPFNPQNYNGLFQLIDSNRKRLEDFFAGTVAHTRSVESTRAYCQKMVDRINRKEYFPFVMHQRREERLIAWIDIKNIDWHIPKAEIGYFIDESCQGKGLISKGVGHVISHVVEKHKFAKLMCRISSANIGSIRVAEKNLFELEGKIRSDYRTTKGELIDLTYYGRVF